MTDERDRRGATVLGVHLPRGTRGEVMISQFREPRLTSVLPLGAAGDDTAALAVASAGKRDATVVLDLGEGDLEAWPAAAFRAALGRMLPGAEVYVCDPDEVLRYLWFHRDRDDPLTLGHAGDRDLIDSTFDLTDAPRHRDRSDRSGQVRALAQTRDLLLTMGTALGVRPPIPNPNGTPGWSPRRVAELTDSVLALYAGLLFRWGSPLFAPRDGREGSPALRLKRDRPARETRAGR